MNPRVALQYEPERNSAARRPFSLSQGERAGVRASVPVFVDYPRVFSVRPKKLIACLHFIRH
jgi:hypothetical protein